MGFFGDSRSYYMYMLRGALVIKPRAIINMELDGLDSCTKPLRISIIKCDAALAYPNPAELGIPNPSSVGVELIFFISLCK